MINLQSYFFDKRQSFNNFFNTNFPIINNNIIVMVRQSISKESGIIGTWWKNRLAAKNKASVDTDREQGMRERKIMEAQSSP